jgi:hypothetical protein
MNHSIPLQLSFTLTEEPGGTYSWSSPYYPYVIYATPYFDNTRGISWQVNDSDGNTLFGGNLPYIDSEAFWVHQYELEDKPLNEHSEFIRYVDFMSCVGLPKILKTSVEHKEQI